ncbi:DUF2478 domain-containing protein [Antarcticimicrobium luteum]|uniref:DUF2478 domain-containing protein n=1 Tax=Antarcticimicrobium luteum TaxID=2547397 RepID=A0A4R5VBT7_9RHOB|nr:DUF2478 domain-containing protein [Antarcticimicrobium luteum]TDK49639.1 DUF2478 domain-containing protein [Antarcticimicrobium luteum]
MKLAYVMTGEPGETDRLLSQFSQTCLAQGIAIAGLVQTNIESADPHHCDMDVLVLPDGPTFRISQSLGREARGCRLDSAALEAAVAAVERTLVPPPALVIVNKFGKREAEGGGFRALIGNCLAEGQPVIVGVNAMNLPAFLAFSDGLAARLPATGEALTDWAQKAARGGNLAA